MAKQTQQIDGVKHSKLTEYHCFHINNMIQLLHYLFIKELAVMARNEYRRRIADELLQTELLSAGAVLIEGAKSVEGCRTGR